VEENKSQQKQGNESDEQEKHSSKVGKEGRWRLSTPEY
jgi:hypothetical protein